MTTVVKMVVNWVENIEKFRSFIKVSSVVRYGRFLLNWGSLFNMGLIRYLMKQFVGG